MAASPEQVEAPGAGTGTTWEALKAPIAAFLEEETEEDGLPIGSDEAAEILARHTPRASNH
jgi:hypothetical protein